MRAIRCKGCGGAVALQPGKAMPECLFCGSPAASLVEEEVETLEQPGEYAPFLVAQEEADQAFREFAGSSIWYPGSLRSADLSLRPLLLPAWAFSGLFETHWSGLVRASTRSGKRPVSGQGTHAVEQCLVPASRSIRRAEIAALGPYDESALIAFSADEVDTPWELSEMSRSAGRDRAVGAVEFDISKALRAEHDLLSIRLSMLVNELSGKPVLVPVWIGAYRHGSRVFRVLVHGQTGKLVGDAPISVWKVAAAIGLALLLLGMGLACLVGGGGLAMVLEG